MPTRVRLISFPRLFVPWPAAHSPPTAPRRHWLTPPRIIRCRGLAGPSTLTRVAVETLIRSCKVIRGRPDRGLSNGPRLSCRPCPAFRTSWPRRQQSDHGLVRPPQHQGSFGTLLGNLTVHPRMAMAIEYKGELVVHSPSPLSSLQIFLLYIVLGPTIISIDPPKSPHRSMYPQCRSTFPAFPPIPLPKRSS
jgi:hypothetical protein